jgi:hypothetical protein
VSLITIDQDSCASLENDRSQWLFDFALPWRCSNYRSVRKKKNSSNVFGIHKRALSRTTKQGNIEKKTRKHRRATLTREGKQVTFGKNPHKEGRRLPKESPIW